MFCRGIINWSLQTKQYLSNKLNVLFCFGFFWLRVISEHSHKMHGEWQTLWAMSGGKVVTDRWGSFCRRHWVELLVFQGEFTAGQTAVLPVCLPLTESSSLCDRQSHQSVELLEHKTPGTTACLQPQQAKTYRPHWVTASASPSTPK